MNGDGNYPPGVTGNEPEITGERGHVERRAERWEIRESLRTLDRMPARMLYAPVDRARRTVGHQFLIGQDARGFYTLLQTAIRFGRIGLYTAGPGPEYVYNVRDYDRWACYEAHEWLALELAEADARG